MNNNVVAQFEQWMSYFVENYAQNEQLKESMLYSLEAGGKRIRPRLLFAAYDYYGLIYNEDMFKVAASIEMVHTYSLIHDDLPAMDDDDYRRGKLTNHKVYGEATAILAGDALLTDAFYLLTKTHFSTSTIVELIRVLSQAAGSSGMVAGQMLDMESENREVTYDTLKRIHRKKTGCLLTAPLMMAAIIAKQNPEKMEKLGEHLGLAFQIRDDILDVIGTKDELGKNPHQDEKANKSTYPKQLTLKGAKQVLNEELDSALNYCQTKNATSLKSLIKQLYIKEGKA